MTEGAAKSGYGVSGTTITLTDVSFTSVEKTYTAEGSVFSGTSTLNVNSYTTNGITFTYKKEKEEYEKNPE